MSDDFFSLFDHERDGKRRHDRHDPHHDHHDHDHHDHDFHDSYYGRHDPDHDRRLHDYHTHDDHDPAGPRPYRGSHGRERFDMERAGMIVQKVLHSPALLLLLGAALLVVLVVVTVAAIVLFPVVNHILGYVSGGSLDRIPAMLRDLALSLLTGGE